MAEKVQALRKNPPAAHTIAGEYVPTCSAVMNAVRTMSHAGQAIRIRGLPAGSY